MASKILVVDDERDIRMSLAGLLEDEGYEVLGAGNDEEALSIARAEKPDIALLDIWLEGSKRDGLGILEEIMADQASITAIMMSGHGTIETAVRAIQLGAYDFIEKPFNIDRIYHLLSRASESARLKMENKELKERLQASEISELQGRSSAVEQLRTTIAKVGPTTSRVLITGPAGSGKEVVARAVHAHSNRADGPFVMLNCATLEPERIEQELFGEEFTDGRSKSGIFEAADQGTLVLDEVSDMPLNTQGKIVRMLQDLAFTRVNGSHKIEVDVRVLATTQSNLEAKVIAGEFREDLYYRLRVFPINIPGLSQRADDIADLADFFLDQIAEQSGQSRRTLAPETLASLCTYDWPGNVRQLRNAIEWMLIMDQNGPEHPIGVECLPPELTDEGPTHGKSGQSLGVSQLIALPLRDAREEFERSYLEAQVKRFMGNVTKTAQFIGMERSALHRKLKSLNIE